MPLLDIHKKKEYLNYTTEQSQVNMCDRCHKVSYRVFEDFYQLGLRYICTTCLNEQERKD